MNVDKKKIEKAIKWAKDQNEYGGQHYQLVDFVRLYFNKNNINYSMFSYNDLETYLNR